MRPILLLSLLLLTAGTPWRGPAVDTLGVRLRSVEYVSVDRVEGQILPPRYAMAYIEASRQPELVWVRYALYADTVLWWPKDRLPCLSGLAPARCFVVGAPAELRPLPLARIDPGETWRLRVGRDTLTTTIFAGYPRAAWDAHKAGRLRLEPAVK